MDFSHFLLGFLIICLLQQEDFNAAASHLSATSNRTGSWAGNVRSGTSTRADTIPASRRNMGTDTLRRTGSGRTISARRNERTGGARGRGRAGTTREGMDNARVILTPVQEGAVRSMRNLLQNGRTASGRRGNPRLIGFLIPRPDGRTQLQLMPNARRFLGGHNLRNRLFRGVQARNQRNSTLPLNLRTIINAARRANLLPGPSVRGNRIPPSRQEQSIVVLRPRNGQAGAFQGRENLRNNQIENQISERRRGNGHAVGIDMLEHGTQHIDQTARTRSHRTNIMDSASRIDPAGRHTVDHLPNGRRTNAVSRDHNTISSGVDGFINIAQGTNHFASNVAPDHRTNIAIIDTVTPPNRDWANFQPSNGSSNHTSATHTQSSIHSNTNSIQQSVPATSVGSNMTSIQELLANSETSPSNTVFQAATGSPIRSQNVDQAFKSQASNLSVGTSWNSPQAPQVVNPIDQALQSTTQTHNSTQNLQSTQLATSSGIPTGIPSETSKIFAQIPQPIEVATSSGIQTTTHVGGSPSLVRKHRPVQSATDKLITVQKNKAQVAESQTFAQHPQPIQVATSSDRQISNTQTGWSHNQQSIPSGTQTSGPQNFVQNRQPIQGLTAQGFQTSHGVTTGKQIGESQTFAQTADSLQMVISRADQVGSIKTAGSKTFVQNHQPLPGIVSQGFQTSQPTGGSQTFTQNPPSLQEATSSSIQRVNIQTAGSQTVARNPRPIQVATSSGMQVSDTQTGGLRNQQSVQISAQIGTQTGRFQNSVQNSQPVQGVPLPGFTTGTQIEGSQIFTPNSPSLQEATPPGIQTVNIPTAGSRIFAHNPRPIQVATSSGMQVSDTQTGGLRNQQFIQIAAPLGTPTGGFQNSVQNSRPVQAVTPQTSNQTGGYTNFPQTRQSIQIAAPSGMQDGMQSQNDAQPLQPLLVAVVPPVNTHSNTQNGVFQNFVQYTNPLQAPTSIHSSGGSQSVNQNDQFIQRPASLGKQARESQTFITRTQNISNGLQSSTQTRGSPTRPQTHQAIQVATSPGIQSGNSPTAGSRTFAQNPQPVQVATSSGMQISSIPTGGSQNQHSIQTVPPSGTWIVWSQNVAQHPQPLQVGTSQGLQTIKQTAGSETFAQNTRPMQIRATQGLQTSKQTGESQTFAQNVMPIKVGTSQGLQSSQRTGGSHAFAQILRPVHVGASQGLQTSQQTAGSPTFAQNTPPIPVGTSQGLQSSQQTGASQTFAQNTQPIQVGTSQALQTSPQTTGSQTFAQNTQPIQVGTSQGLQTSQQTGGSQIFAQNLQPIQVGTSLGLQTSQQTAGSQTFAQNAHPIQVGTSQGLQTSQQTAGSQTFAQNTPPIQVDTSQGLQKSTQMGGSQTFAQNTPPIQVGTSHGLQTSQRTGGSQAFAQILRPVHVGTTLGLQTRQQIAGPRTFAQNTQPMQVGTSQGLQTTIQPGGSRTFAQSPQTIQVVTSSGIQTSSIQNGWSQNQPSIQTVPPSGTQTVWSPNVAQHPQPIQVGTSQGLQTIKQTDGSQTFAHNTRPIQVDTSQGLQTGQQTAGSQPLAQLTPPVQVGTSLGLQTGQQIAGSQIFAQNLQPIQVGTSQGLQTHQQTTGSRTFAQNPQPIQIGTSQGLQTGQQIAGSQIFAQNLQPVQVGTSQGLQTHQQRAGSRTFAQNPQPMKVGTSQGLQTSQQTTGSQTFAQNLQPIQVGTSQGLQTRTQTGGSQAFAQNTQPIQVDTSLGLQTGQQTAVSQPLAQITQPIQVGTSLGLQTHQQTAGSRTFAQNSQPMKVGTSQGLQTSQQTTGSQTFAQNLQPIHIGTSQGLQTSQQTTGSQTFAQNIQPIQVGTSQGLQTSQQTTGSQTFAQNLQPIQVGTSQGLQTSQQTTGSRTFAQNIQPIQVDTSQGLQTSQQTTVSQTFAQNLQPIQVGTSQGLQTSQQTAGSRTFAQNTQPMQVGTSQGLQTGQQTAGSQAFVQHSQPIQAGTSQGLQTRTQTGGSQTFVQNLQPIQVGTSQGLQSSQQTTGSQAFVQHSQPIQAGTSQGLQTRTQTGGSQTFAQNTQPIQVGTSQGLQTRTQTGGSQTFAQNTQPTQVGTSQGLPTRTQTGGSQTFAQNTQPIQVGTSHGLQTSNQMGASQTFAQPVRVGTSQGLQTPTQTGGSQTFAQNIQPIPVGTSQGLQTRTHTGGFQTFAQNPRPLQVGTSQGLQTRTQTGGSQTFAQNTQPTQVGNSQGIQTRTQTARSQIFAQNRQPIQVGTPQSLQTSQRTGASQIVAHNPQSIHTPTSSDKPTGRTQTFAQNPQPLQVATSQGLRTIIQTGMFQNFAQNPQPMQVDTSSRMQRGKLTGEVQTSGQNSQPIYVVSSQGHQISTQTGRSQNFSQIPQTVQLSTVSGMHTSNAQTGGPQNQHPMQTAAPSIMQTGGSQTFAQNTPPIQVGTPQGLQSSQQTAGSQTFAQNIQPIQVGTSQGLQTNTLTGGSQISAQHSQSIQVGISQGLQTSKQTGGSPTFTQNSQFIQTAVSSGKQIVGSQNSLPHQVTTSPGMQISTQLGGYQTTRNPQVATSSGMDTRTQTRQNQQSALLPGMQSINTQKTGSQTFAQNRQSMQIASGIQDGLQFAQPLQLVFVDAVPSANTHSNTQNGVFQNFVQYTNPLQVPTNTRSRGSRVLAQNSQPLQVLLSSGVQTGIRAGGFRTNPPNPQTIEVGTSSGIPTSTHMGVSPPPVQMYQNNEQPLQPALTAAVPSVNAHPSAQAGVFQNFVQNTQPMRGATNRSSVRPTNMLPQNLHHTQNSPNLPTVIQTVLPGHMSQNPISTQMAVGSPPATPRTGISQSQAVKVGFEIAPNTNGNMQTARPHGNISAQQPRQTQTNIVYQLPGTTFTRKPALPPVIPVPPSSSSFISQTTGHIMGSSAVHQSTQNQTSAGMSMAASPVVRVVSQVSNNITNSQNQINIHNSRIRTHSTQPIQQAIGQSTVIQVRNTNNNTQAPVLPSTQGNANLGQFSSSVTNNVHHTTQTKQGRQPAVVSELITNHRSIDATGQVNRHRNNNAPIQIRGKAHLQNSNVILNRSNEPNIMIQSNTNQHQMQRVPLVGTNTNQNQMQPNTIIESGITGGSNTMQNIQNQLQGQPQMKNTNMIQIEIVGQSKVHNGMIGGNNMLNTNLPPNPLPQQTTIQFANSIHSTATGQAMRPSLSQSKSNSNTIQSNGNIMTPMHPLHSSTSSIATAQLKPTVAPSITNQTHANQATMLGNGTTTTNNTLIVRQPYVQAPNIPMHLPKLNTSGVLNISATVVASVKSVQTNTSSVQGPVEQSLSNNGSAPVVLLAPLVQTNISTIQGPVEQSLSNNGGVPAMHLVPLGQTNPSAVQGPVDQSLSNNGVVPAMHLVPVVQTNPSAVQGPVEQSLSNNSSVSAVHLVPVVQTNPSAVQGPVEQSLSNNSSVSAVHLVPVVQTNPSAVQGPVEQSLSNNGSVPAVLLLPLVSTLPDIVAVNNSGNATNRTVNRHPNANNTTPAKVSANGRSTPVIHVEQASSKTNPAIPKSVGNSVITDTGGIVNATSSKSTSVVGKVTITAANTSAQDAGGTVVMGISTLKTLMSEVLLEFFSHQFNTTTLTPTTVVNATVAQAVVDALTVASPAAVTPVKNSPRSVEVGERFQNLPAGQTLHNALGLSINGQQPKPRLPNEREVGVVRHRQRSQNVGERNSGKARNSQLQQRTQNDFGLTVSGKLSNIQPQQTPQNGDVKYSSQGHLDNKHTQMRLKYIIKTLINESRRVGDVDLQKVMLEGINKYVDRELQLHNKNTRRKLQKSDRIRVGGYMYSIQALQQLQVVLSSLGKGSNRISNVKLQNTILQWIRNVSMPRQTPAFKRKARTRFENSPRVNSSGQNALQILQKPRSAGLRPSLANRQTHQRSQHRYAQRVGEQLSNRQTRHRAQNEQKANVNGNFGNRHKWLQRPGIVGQQRTKKTRPSSKASMSGTFNKTNVLQILQKDRGSDIGEQMAIQKHLQNNQMNGVSRPGQNNVVSGAMGKRQSRQKQQHAEVLGVSVLDKMRTRVKPVNGVSRQVTRHRPQSYHRTRSFHNNREQQKPRNIVAKTSGKVVDAKLLGTLFKRLNNTTKPRRLHPTIKELNKNDVKRISGRSRANPNGRSPFVSNVKHIDPFSDSKSRRPLRNIKPRKAMSPRNSLAFRYTTRSPRLPSPGPGGFPVFLPSVSQTKLTKLKHM